MTYDIVIATRDRQSVLPLSIPLMLRQSVPPARVIVVDSSSDHVLTRLEVERCTSEWASQGGIVEVIRSAPGLCRQRNEGLMRVTADVTMYPDDDALWFDGFAAAVMDVYRRDTERRIAAVCGAPIAESPVPLLSGSPHKVSLKDVVRGKAQPLFDAMDKKLAPDPFVVYGASLFHKAQLPDWFAQNDVVPVEWMTGFRMSFRTEVVRQHGFEPAFRDYSLFEDVDASFAAAQYGLVVGARRAKVYHYRVPGKRGDGREMGFTQLLNRAYIILKYVEDEAYYQPILFRFLRSKIARYALAAASRFGRERLTGAVAGYRAAKELTRLPRAERRAAYDRRMTELRDCRAEAREHAKNST